MSHVLEAKYVLFHTLVLVSGGSDLLRVSPSETEGQDLNSLRQWVVGRRALCLNGGALMGPSPWGRRELDMMSDFTHLTIARYNSVLAGHMEFQRVLMTAKDAVCS